MSDVKRADLLELATDIVAAYVGANEMPPGDVPGFIAEVFAALETASEEQAEPEPEILEPAVPLTESLTDDFLICLEDGLPFKSLKRHLRTKYDLTPQAYRDKWGLPKDYPMVAPNYAKERSALAKKSGLGKGPRT